MTLPLVGIGQMSRLNACCLPIPDCFITIWLLAHGQCL